MIYLNAKIQKRNEKITVIDDKDSIKWFFNSEKDGEYDEFSTIVGMSCTAIKRCGISSHDEIPLVTKNIPLKIGFW